MPLSRSARTICLAISEPSLSLVDANDSFRRMKLFGVIWSTIELILLSSSSSFPLLMVLSSSRLKCVNKPSQTLALKDSAGTNIPHAGIVVGVEEALEDSLAAELVPQSQHGLAFGILAAVNAVGDFASSFVIGLLWSVASPSLAFGLSGALFLLGSLLVLRTR